LSGVRTADLVAVGLAAWWLRGFVTRRALRAKFKRIEAGNPEAAAIAKRVWPKLADYVDSQFAEPMTIPVVVGVYVALRGKRRG
jgi:hypothetical protein